jgi:signal transduction histidine kinase
MTVPLKSHDRVIGAITYIRRADAGTFAEHDKVLADDLAARCAKAIENARILEDSVDARQTAEDALRQVGAAKNAAEQANMVKMRFLSTMSHELRTPLNAIAGYAELLETGIRGQLNLAQLSDVQRIHAAEKHLLSLVESVLDYAKIEAGRSSFGLKDILLASVLVEVNDIIAPLAAEKHLTCEGCATTPTDLTVFADPEKLKQLLINLLTNAIKFTPDGGLVTVMEEIRGDLVLIHVRDTGIGIGPEDQEAIFQPFVQVDNGFSRTYGGTGLGLAISQEIAIGMGGKLTVESTLGHGATFTLTLSRGRDRSVA